MTRGMFVRVFSCAHRGVCAHKSVVARALLEIFEDIFIALCGGDLRVRGGVWSDRVCAHKSCRGGEW